MVKDIWKAIAKHLWPVLWPVFRKFLILVAEDVVKFLYEHFRAILEKQTRSTRRYAESEKTAAQRRAAKAKSPEDKMFAEREVSVWQSVIAKLEADKLQLQTELERALKSTDKYAHEHIERGALKSQIQGSILALPPPKEGS